MNKTTKSIREIIRFLNMAAMWQQQKQAQGQSHLKFAIFQVMPGCEKANRDHESKLARVNIEHCTSDEKGNIQLDKNSSFIYTKEAATKRNDAAEKLLDDKAEVVSYFAKVVPSDLTPAQEQAFAGFVIPELIEPPIPEGPKPTDPPKPGPNGH